jgi:BirA family biotin operon repressor/biotin-[acetyl-CoA-carboxylase] ligase
LKPLLFPLLRKLSDGRFHSGEALAEAMGVSRATIWQTLGDAEILGLRVFRVRGRGYRLDEPLDLIDRDVVENLCEPAGPFQLELLDTVPSTNGYLIERAAQGAAHGRVAVAELQTRGRGRYGRQWVSGMGGALTFSVLWRFGNGIAGLSGLSLAVGLAVARACEGLGAAGVKLKWPNDVVHHGRKLAGILIEVQGEILGPSVAVIGIGLNYRLPPAARDAIDQPVVDLAEIIDRLPSRNIVLATLLRELGPILLQFEAVGFAPFATDWEARHAYQEKQVRLALPDQSAVNGIALGVAADGALKLGTHAGPMQFSVGEISLRPA